MSHERPVQTDAELIAQVIFRDPDALKELYDRHSRVLYALLRKMLPEQRDAEQVLEEVFVDVWNGRATYSAHAGGPGLWLIGVTRQRGIERLRSNAAEGRPLGAVPTPTAVPGARARSYLTSRQLQVQHALEALPTDQREFIERAYFHGATYSELATYFNLPLVSVRASVRAGLLTLRRLVKADETDPD